MFDALYYDKEWFIAVGVLFLFTVLYILVISAATKDPNWMKQNEVDNDGGCGCGCMMALGVFFLCYMWTAVFVSMVEYGRPFDGKPKNQKKEDENRKGKGGVHSLLHQHPRSSGSANT